MSYVRHELLVAAVRRALPFVLFGAAFGLFWYAGSYRTKISWNAIDLDIGRNLLRGEGFVDFPSAPPNLWNQPLTPVLAGVSELVFDDAIRVITACCFFGPALAYYADTRYSWNFSNDPPAYPRATVLSMGFFPDVDYLVISHREAARHTFSSEQLLGLRRT